MEFEPTAEAEAKKINRQTGAGYVTDQAFWVKRGIITGEDLALSVLDQTYSDLYKELHGFRPRHESFETVEEIQRAIKDLDNAFNVMIEMERIDIEAQAAYEAERAELEELMPGVFDFDHMPTRSGMGRRVESKLVKRTTLSEALGFTKSPKKINNKSLRKLILSEMRILFEEDEEKDKSEVESTGDPGKDLEAAYAGGPEGVRAFMDAQGNKDSGVQKVLVKAAESDDGVDPDDKISVGSATPVGVSGLGPTQQFIDLMQSVSFPLGSANVLEQAITSKTSGAPGAISISGNAVLDGHHRWSSVYAITPDGSINAKDFGFPGGVSDKLAAAQLAVAAVNDSGTQPSKGGGAATDIIGKKKEAIVAMIDANKGKQTDKKAPGALLNDPMIQAIADGKHPEINKWAGLSGDEEFVSLADSESGFANDPIRKGIADKVGANLGSLPQPLGGAPESREDMPQLDHESIGGSKGLSAIEKGLPAGEFNVVPPFTKESRMKKDNLIIERWQKLAGILKN
tara:strand:+ start:809 stop:2350 length:1542 start_codon:yes stop_codon:yes gene_type:complete